MHNNGNFNALYKTNDIPVPDRKPIIDSEYKKFNRNKKRLVPFKVTPALFPQLSCSHIEFLHHLHNMIQKNHFGQKIWYGYKAAHKTINWRRILTGV